MVICKLSGFYCIQLWLGAIWHCLSFRGRPRAAFQGVSESFLVAIRHVES